MKEILSRGKFLRGLATASLALLLVVGAAQAAVTVATSSVVGTAALTITATGAASSWTLASDGAADDLTVGVTGATDSSLILSSTGTGVDAVKMNATAGGLDIDADDGIAIDAVGAAGEDIVITNTGGSISLVATEAVVDAIVLNASTALGGIDITSQNDIDISTTGAAGEDISLLNTGGSINITATEAITDAIVLNASVAGGGIDITSNEDIDISTTGAAGEDISLTNTGGSINLSSTEKAASAIYLLTNGGTSETIVVTNTQGTDPAAIGLTSSAGGITLTSNLATADGINLTATGGGLDLDATLGATLDVVTFLSLDVTSATAASNISVVASADTEDLTIGTTGTAGDLLLVSADAFDMLSAGVFSIDGTGASNVSTTSGDLVISTITSGELDLTSAGLVDLNAGANLDIDVTGSYDMLATTTFSIDGTGASNVTATSGDLTLSTATSGILILSSAGNTTIDALDASSIDIGASIVTASDTSAVNIGTSATARTITIGNAASTILDLNAISVDIDGAATGVTIDALDAGTLNLGTSTDAASDQAGVNIGTGGTRTIAIGSATTILNATAKVGSLVNLSAATNTTAAVVNNGLIIPISQDCALGVTEGQICWDSDNDTLYIGDAVGAPSAISPSTGSDNSWTGDQTYTFGATENIAIDAATTDTTLTEGVLNIDVDTITASAIGASLDFQVGDAAAANTYYSLKNDVTVDIDAAEIATVYGNYVGLTVNHATGVTYGMGIVAQDAGAQVVTAGLLIENLQATDIDMTDAILIRATTADSIATALNVSDAEITTAINVGPNIILGTTAVINFDGFDVAATTGATIIAGSAEGTAALTLTLGDVLISDGDLTLAGGEIEIPDNTAAFAVIEDATGGLDYLNIATTNGTEAIIIGHSTVDSITFTTDDTGDGTDVVLPAQSIGTAEILNDTITFANISDSSAIDADTAFTAADGITLTLTPTHTAGDANFLTIDANQTDDVNATDNFDVLRLDLTSESGDAGDTFDGLVIIWENGTANTIMDSAIKINNAETTASTMTDAIIVSSSGIDTGVTDALDVSADNIVNAVNVGPNPIIGTSWNVNATTALTVGDVATGTNAATVAIFSSDWEISTTGAMTGIGAITLDGAITGGTSGTFSTFVAADAYRVTNSTHATGDITKAEMQAASYWSVDVSAGAVDYDLDEALDAGDIGRYLSFAITSGHVTNALTVTTGAGVNVTNLQAGPGASCEDNGDFIQCLITASGTATCVSFCAD